MKVNTKSNKLKLFLIASNIKSIEANRFVEEAVQELQAWIKKDHPIRLRMRDKYTISESAIQARWEMGYPTKEREKNLKQLKKEYSQAYNTLLFAYTMLGLRYVEQNPDILENENIVNTLNKLVMEDKYNLDVVRNRNRPLYFQTNTHKDTINHWNMCFKSND